jgi:5-methylcytosine-specific restriction endonuclease McrA
MYNAGMRQIGKVGKEWAKARRQWFKDHPGEYFYCSLRISKQCPGATRREETTLDHIISRSRRPDLRFDPDNLQPACQWCNAEKGSRELQQSSY